MLPKDFLDNNWWNNVKRLAWKDCTANRKKTLSLSFLHFLSFPLLFSSLSHCLSACLCMVIESFIPQLCGCLHVFICVCAVLCAISLYQHLCGLHQSNLDSTNPVTADLCFNSLTTCDTMTHTVGSVTSYSG